MVVVYIGGSNLLSVSPCICMYFIHISYFIFHIKHKQLGYKHESLAYGFTAHMICNNLGNYIGEDCPLTRHPGLRLSVNEPCFFIIIL